MKRLSFKVTNFNINRIKREMFETKRSYEYFLLGFKAAQQIQKLKDSGYLLIDDGEPFDSKYNFHIAFDKNGKNLIMPRLGPSHNGGMVMWLGATMGNIDDTVFVYKSEMKIFTKITYINPEHQQKFDFIY